MRAYKFDQYLKSVRSSESYEFISANKVYVDTNLPVRECMLKFFQDEIEKLVSKQHRKYENILLSNNNFKYSFYRILKLSLKLLAYI